MGKAIVATDQDRMDIAAQLRDRAAYWAGQSSSAPDKVARDLFGQVAARLNTLAAAIDP